jgi:hypothetical protein
MDGDDTEIVLEQDDGTQVEPQQPEKPIITAEEGIEDLKRKLAEERQARLDAETRAREAASRAQEAKTEVEDANLTVLKSAIETVKRDQATAKANWRAAMANGDYEAAAEAQEAGQLAAARLLKLEDGKAALETRPKQAPQPRQVDPVEALASQLTPRSAAWVRAHPEYASNQRLYQKMIAAHNLAVADGVEADTDAYFQSIEETLRLRQPVVQHEDPMAQAAQPVRKAAPPAAPVSRGTVNGSRTNVIRLTADEREMASMMGMTDEEYAKNKRDLIAAGRMN